MEINLEIDDVEKIIKKYFKDNDFKNKGYKLSKDLEPVLWNEECDMFIVSVELDL